MEYFIADTADIYGDVKIGKDSSIWFQAVLRGDCNTITIGENTNIQDGTVIHVDHPSAVAIGDNVTIGHQCIIHGCEIQNGVLIGMGSIVLNDAVIGENSLIGAGSLVTEGTVIPPNMLAFGSPAKVIRPLTTAEIEKNRKNADYYQEESKAYQLGEFPKLS